MDVALLGQVIQACADTGKLNGTASARHAASIAFGTMNALPDTGRFSLNIQFMDASDKSNAEACFSWLKVVATDELAGANEGGLPLTFSKESVEDTRLKFER